MEMVLKNFLLRFSILPFFLHFSLFLSIHIASSFTLFSLILLLYTGIYTFMLLTIWILIRLNITHHYYVLL
ncbi:hypothetical protein BC941DRAFT_45003 [Chlamydoabsidia padenii]|nr:hypothetical protein BC941DRAFT_45003 [Chlamydoabsidia padenii]